MSSITKLLKKSNFFEWIKECQNVWEEINNRYIQALNLINPNWELEFHIHTNASQLVIGAILIENLIGKFDQLVMYASIFITPKCVLVHFMFHYILNEFGHFYLVKLVNPLMNGDQLLRIMNCLNSTQ